MSGTLARGLAAQRGPDGTVERVTVWECVGCGKIEAPQPCIGVCEDRRAEFVYATDYDGKLKELAAVRRQMAILAGLVRQIACTTPRRGECDRTYGVMQDRARRMMREMAADEIVNPQGGRNAQA